VTHILESRPHPEQGYRACLGILRQSKPYGSERLEAACAKALAVGATSYRSVVSILKAGLDRQPLAPPERDEVSLDHPNIRGPGYYN
jgi:transposase